MNTFEQILNKTLASEGGYSNAKTDKGGETYKGISRRWHPGWDGWEIVDMVKGVDGGFEALKRGNISNVTSPAYQAKLDQLVKLFYFEEFWKRIKGDAIAFIDEDIAFEVFDMEVNSNDGARILQKTLNHLGAKLTVDGIVGPVTLHDLSEAVDRYGKEKVLDTYQKFRVLHYAEEVRRDPSQAANIVGWVKRALRIG